MYSGGGEKVLRKGGKYNFDSQLKILFLLGSDSKNFMKSWMFRVLGIVFS